MDVRSVLTAYDSPTADAACEELRAHGIRCETTSPKPDVPDIGPSYSGPHPGIDVWVAPEDEERANGIVQAWLRTLL
jgi:hypothetical protein